MANSSFLIRCIAILFSLCVIAPLSGQVRSENNAIKKNTMEEALAKERTRWMFRNLSLDRDQHEKVYDINIACARAVDSLNKLKDNPQKNNLKYKARIKRDSLLKTTLTLQQYRQFVLYNKRLADQQQSHKK